MNSDRTSDFEQKYHLSGDLLNTQMSLIHQALEAVFGSESLRLKSRDDLFVKKDDFSLNVYARGTSKLGGKNYLVGGNFYGDYDRALRVLHALGRELLERDIVYSFELYDQSAVPRRDDVVISHPEFEKLLGE